MQLTFSTLACPDWTLPQIIGAAAANGMNGIDFRGIAADIDITRLAEFNDELPATMEMLRQHNLKVPCLNTSISVVSPAAERWQMMLDECHRHAVLADKLHTHFLRVFGGAIPKDLTREEARLLAIRHLRQLVKICAPAGCCVLLETHDAWSTSPQVLELISDFTPDEVGVLLDLEHPFRGGESPALTMEALGTRIRHVHIKDSNRISNKNIPTLLGQGTLPLVEMLGALRSINYDGWICLETEKRWHREQAPGPEQSLPQFVEFMKANWLASAG